MILSFVIATVVVFGVAYLGGSRLAKGSEQETYDTLKGDKLAYEAAITAPPVEEKPWVPIYRDCTPCDCGSCGTVKLQWLAFGVVLIAGIFGLHFLLV